jgi:hypothetical protein
VRVISAANVLERVAVSEPQRTQLQHAEEVQQRINGTRAWLSHVALQEWWRTMYEEIGAAALRWRHDRSIQ